MKFRFKNEQFEMEVNDIELKRFDKLLEACFELIGDEKALKVIKVEEDEKRNKQQPNGKAKAIDGIKQYPDGTVAYACCYKCSNCNYSSYRYLIKDNEGFTYCHRCDQELMVMRANDNFTPDEEFNYFIAY